MPSSNKNAKLDLAQFCVRQHSEHSVSSSLELGTQFRFKSGQLLGEAEKDIKSIYLIQSGLISIVVLLRDGGAVATALLGRGMLLGGGYTFGAQTWLNTAVAQMAGTARAINSEVFLRAAHEHPAVQELAFQSEQVILAQAQQSAACNASHVIERRLCTWLLRAHELSEATELPVTQDSLASMLGVQRGSISKISADLQRQGAVECRRGRVKIADKAKLQSSACECYSAFHAIVSAIYI